jgi:histidinol-phosphate/aromatic aminotransferase/cobyric acid decarboxylase-like protein
MTELDDITRQIIWNRLLAIVEEQAQTLMRIALPDDVLLLVDEAYAGFVDEDFHAPIFDLVEQGNTEVTRTFTKIYGLAGLRVDWGYFPGDIRDQLRKVLNPSSVGEQMQLTAETLAAWQDQHHG